MANMTSAVKTLVDALTVDPASTETSLVNHASHHDVVHTALQEIYDKTVYVAKLVQTSTNAPTATEIENSTGATMTWARTDTGQYTLTASGVVFTGGKTFVSFSAPRTAQIDFVAVWQTTVLILVQSYNNGAAADALFSSDYIKVEIYT